MVFHRISILSCALAATVILSISGCHNVDKSSNAEAVNLMDAASKARDYERMLSLADSLGKTGKLLDAGDKVPGAERVSTISCYLR